MTNFELWGPFTGAALKTHAPISYRKMRRRKAIIAAAVAVAIGALIGGGLWIVNH